MSKSKTAATTKSLTEILAHRDLEDRVEALDLLRLHVARQVAGTASMDDSEAAEVVAALRLLNLSVARFDELVATAGEVARLEAGLEGADERVAAADAGLKNLLVREEAIRIEQAAIRRDRVAFMATSSTIGSERRRVEQLRTENPMLFGDPEMVFRPAAAPVASEPRPCAAIVRSSGADDPFRLQTA